MRWMRFVLAFVLACVAGASEVAAKLDRALQAVPAGGRASVALLDLTTDTWVYQRQAEQPLSLASTTKLLTAAAAFAELGPAFRFSTRVVGIGPQHGDSLSGLGIIGGGDPCLDGHFYDEDPDLVFRQWADHCKRLGIARILGDIVIDNRLFAGPIRPETYPQDAENQQRWYSAPASAFAWNDNCIEVRMVPTVPGHPAEAQVRPHSRRIQVRNLTRTVAGKSDSRFSVTRDGDDNILTVSGTYTKPTAWFPLAIADEPDLLAADHLKHVLERAGIAVSGEVRIGAVEPNAGPLLIDLQHDLVPALTLMNQHSQNFYAEQVLRQIGAHRLRQGSIDAGCKAVLEVLAPALGRSAATVSLLDGSGLSYDNRASAEAMVTLLRAMHRSDWRDAFTSTLKSKDSGKSRGMVKTGTLAIACCLAGYVDLPSGHRLGFAILLNKGTARDFGWASKLRESLFKIMCGG
ncbi:MAG: D-alanyl-D-alanine carboxypeptidase/D-alanyl-D-alanine-endopeptidase [Planctomycetes bacterium]|nr:D-alanyl-D-alanine carboxypeptidase/D-alanyl-D-alanine-endopeptidase [Planctomycetota bacterium]